MKCRIRIEVRMKGFVHYWEDSCRAVSDHSYFPQMTYSSISSSLPMESFLFDQGTISNHSYSDHTNHELIKPPFIQTSLHLPSDSSTSLNPASDGYAGDNYDYNNPVLKYISDILLEEDIEDKPIFDNCLALQAAEKSFRDVLDQKDSTFNQSFKDSDDYRGSCFSNGDTYESVDPSETFHQVDSSLVGCLPDTSLVSDDSLSKLQRLGNSGRVEEANKLHENFKFIDAERYEPLPHDPQIQIGSNRGNEQQSDVYNASNRSEARKNGRRQDGHCVEEWRSNKRSVAYCAVDSDLSELQEMFDKVLLFQGMNQESADFSSHHEFSNKGSRQTKGSKPACSRRQSKEEKVVDLSTMLIQCAQAIASYDQRNASKLLKQIRQHSSPYGDATQRVAHYFADGLEVRLVGTRTPLFSPVASMQTSSVDILKAYQTGITASPWRTLPQFFANLTIMKLAEKATSLHIIDIGTSYGFQWPSLIQWLSERHGGPPKLRITAIELPLPGFRPTERVEETGRRLVKYSARFSVPFKFHCIGQKWETLRVDDLKIDRNELIMVNCLHRLRHVPDVTMMGNSPRDDVLKLIRKINPEIFIHAVVNGAYNSSFFLTRFKQALIHFNSAFDAFETTTPREDHHRLFFENFFYGRPIMNVVACEGLERVERPETYQKWQVRNVRAGLKQLPLDQELLKKVKAISKSIGYHNNFTIDEDEQWMLQGWNGRIIMALSLWKRE